LYYFRAIRSYDRQLEINTYLLTKNEESGFNQTYAMHLDRQFFSKTLIVRNLIVKPN